eukprot:comp20041_c0_seq1/m.39303 comp20041_c0_seq1/g.39303  ORF comp20041_c0_seq1/g.39303 comp20041_c0_seq1/m.39303 type:complete len:413 (-) comp20041_c0_seq1:47-1285(-)
MNCPFLMVSVVFFLGIVEPRDERRELRNHVGAPLGHDRNPSALVPLLDRVLLEHIGIVEQLDDLHKGLVEPHVLHTVRLQLVDQLNLQLDAVANIRRKDLAVGLEVSDKLRHMLLGPLRPLDRLHQRLVEDRHCIGIRDRKGRHVALEMRVHLRSRTLAPHHLRELRGHMLQRRLLDKLAQILEPSGCQLAQHLGGLALLVGQQLGQNLVCLGQLDAGHHFLRRAVVAENAQHREHKRLGQALVHEALRVLQPQHKAQRLLRHRARMEQPNELGKPRNMLLLECTNEERQLAELLLEHGPHKRLALQQRQGRFDQCIEVLVLLCGKHRQLVCGLSRRADFSSGRNLLSSNKQLPEDLCIPLEIQRVAANLDRIQPRDKVSEPDALVKARQHILYELLGVIVTDLISLASLVA